MHRLALGWSEIEQDCAILASEIEYCDAILSLGRGGLVPGVILSNLLDCKVFNFGLKSYKEKLAGDIVVTQPPGIKFNSDYRNKKILVVDDLSDKGSTLLYVKEYLDTHEFKYYRFATLYIKKSTKFTPTYYVREFDDTIWLDFPWEIAKLE